MDFKYDITEMKLECIRMHINEIYDKIDYKYYFFKIFLIKGIIDFILSNGPIGNKYILKKWLLFIEFLINPDLNNYELDKSNKYYIKHLNSQIKLTEIYEESQNLNKKIVVYLCKIPKMLNLIYLNYINRTSNLSFEIIRLISEFLLEDPIEMNQLSPKLINKSLNQLMLEFVILINIFTKKTFELRDKLNDLHQQKSYTKSQITKYKFKHIIINKKLAKTYTIREYCIKKYTKYCFYETQYYKHKALSGKFNYWMANIYKEKLKIYDLAYDLCVYIREYIILFLGKKLE